MPSAKEATLLHILNATAHASSTTRVISWRQGLYGLASVAAGADGYETGICIGESYHYPNHQIRHAAATNRPKADRGRSGAGAYVYLETMNRSIARTVASALLADDFLQGQLICSDPVYCCPDGAESMMRDWRGHAIRARARQLKAMADMPGTIKWRLKMIADDATRAQVASAAANELLAEQSIARRLPVDTFTALHHAAEVMRGVEQQVA